MVAGALLVGWIVDDVLMVTADDELVSPTEVVFLSLGMAMTNLGFVLARTERRAAA